MTVFPTPEENPFKFNTEQLDLSKPYQPGQRPRRPQPLHPTPQSSTPPVPRIRQGVVFEHYSLSKLLLMPVSGVLNNIAFQWLHRRGLIEKPKAEVKRDRPGNILLEIREAMTRFREVSGYPANALTIGDAEYREVYALFKEWRSRLNLTAANRPSLRAFLEVEQIRVVRQSEGWIVFDHRDSLLVSSGNPSPLVPKEAKS